jgi:hypothetical protein
MKALSEHVKQFQKAVGVGNLPPNSFQQLSETLRIATY